MLERQHLYFQKRKIDLKGSMNREQEFIDYFLIVGLGNPGGEFVGTAHNVGRDFLIEHAKKNDEKFEHSGCKSYSILRTSFAGKPVIFLLPETYMNRSGLAVLECIRYFKINLRKVCVIHDDSDQIIGSLKLTKGQSSGGHKGIESIIASIGNKSFARLKVGVRPPSLASSEGKDHIKAERFVLKKIDSDSRERAFAKIEAAVSVWLEKGTDLAMNFVNRKE